MKVVNDYVMVKVASELNTFAGLIHDEHGNEVQLVLNPNFKPTHHSRICAEVVAVPEYLTGKDNPLYELDPGLPRPLSYRGHEYIHGIMKNIPLKYQKNHRVPYNCGLFTPRFQTHQGLKVEVEPGDKVYFHYNSLLNEENYMYRDADGMLVYKILYSNLFCVIKNHEIKMLNGFILVQEIYDEDVQDIDIGNGVTIKGKMRNNLVMSTGDKPLYLSGILRHIGEPIGPCRRDTKPGMMVMFRPSSEFINMIENEAYYVMRQWDIMASWIPDEEVARYKEANPRLAEMMDKFDWICPEGDYIMVEPENIATKQKTKIYDPSAATQDFKPGEIFVLADSVKDNKKKKIYSFGVGKVISVGNLCPVDITNKRIMYGKGSYYVYVEEYGVAFIKAGDVFGYPG